MDLRCLAFLNCVREWIEEFLEGSREPGRVFLFPNCNNYKRYLIHNLVSEEFKKEGLCTFSVGSGSERRLVIAMEKDLKQHEQIVDGLEESKEEDTWDMLYDEDGKPIKPEISIGISAKVTKPKVHCPSSSKSEEFEFLMEHGDKHSNILELYSTTTLTTHDVRSALLFYLERGLYLKWIDNSHALAVFPCSKMAVEVMKTRWAAFNARPLSKGTAASKEAAQTLIVPSSLRPQTNPNLVKRLVAGALGIKTTISPKEREAEKKMLREAKEEKKLATRQKIAAWEGTIGRKDMKPNDTKEPVEPKQ